MNVKIMGADQSVTNLVSTTWAPTLQAFAQRGRLYKVTFSPLAGMAADVYVWLFNLAAGSASSVAPVAVRLIPAGLGDTWDFSADGSLFTNGLYVALATARPTDGTTAPVSSGNNKLIVKADIRIG